MSRAWSNASAMMLVGSGVAEFAGALIAPIAVAVYLVVMGFFSACLGVALFTRTKPRALPVSPERAIADFRAAKRNQRLTEEHGWLLAWFMSLPLDHRQAYIASRNGTLGTHRMWADRELARIGFHRHEGAHHCGITKLLNR